MDYFLCMVCHAVKFFVPDMLFREQHLGEGLLSIGRHQKSKEDFWSMSLSYHRQADLAFAQKQVEEFSSACFLFLPNTNRQIFICLKKLYSLIQIYATLYKKP